MKITRYTHSCLLVQDTNTTILCDPGSFAWASGLVDLASWPEVNTIVITHEHGDHFSEPFVQALHQNYPKAQWVTTAPVMEKLQALGITNVTTESTPSVLVTPIQHEALPAGFGPAPANIQVDLLGRLTHPGDSHSMSKSSEILAIAYIAPWGSMTAAMDVVLKLKPKTVVPIHDALWKDEVRDGFYRNFQSVLQERGITFVIPVDGAPFEL